VSQENVEIVRRYYEAELPAALDQWAAFVERFWERDGDYYPIRSFPEAKPCHGRDEISAFFCEYFATWGSYEYTVLEVEAVGDDRVFAHGHLRAAGGESGIGVHGDLYHCCWLRHGRLIRSEDHRTAKGALRALGLSGDSLEAAGLGE
jgi:hypothetical protein